MSLVTRGQVVSLPEQTAKQPSTGAAHGWEARGRVVKTNLTDAAQLAARIVADAKTTAAALMDQFERDKARIRGELYAEALANAEFEQVRKTLDLATLRQRIVEAAQQDIVAIARLLAERVLSEELTIRPERIVELARQILREARGARNITVCAAPQVAARLNCEIERLGTDANACITILPDDDLGHGDLRIETDVGNIDARLGTQLTHLASAIVESIRS